MQLLLETIMNSQLPLYQVAHHLIPEGQYLRAFSLFDISNIGPLEYLREKGHKDHN